MSQSPELDQVVEVRRRLAEHTLLPRWYWAMTTVFVVVLAGLPVWESYLSPQALNYAVWVPALLAVILMVAERVRRSRSGVHLPRGMGAYPSVWRVWVPLMALTAVAYLGIMVLVNHDQRGVALALVPVVAVLTLAGTLLVRRSMRADIEAGRVRA